MKLKGLTGESVGVEVKPVWALGPVALVTIEDGAEAQLDELTVRNLGYACINAAEELMRRRLAREKEGGRA